VSFHALQALAWHVLYMVIFFSVDHRFVSLSRALDFLLLSTAISTASLFRSFGIVAFCIWRRNCEHHPRDCFTELRLTTRVGGVSADWRLDPEEDCFSTDFYLHFLGGLMKRAVLIAGGLLVVAAFVPFLHSTTETKRPFLDLARIVAPERQWEEKFRRFLIRKITARTCNGLRRTRTTSAHLRQEQCGMDCGEVQEFGLETQIENFDVLYPSRRSGWSS